MALAQFGSQEVPLSLRTSCQFRVWGHTRSPLAVNVGVTLAHVKGIVAQRDTPVFNRRVSHLIAPVIQIIHAGSFSWHDLRPSLGRAWKGGTLEGLIVGNPFVISLPIALHALFVGS